MSRGSKFIVKTNMDENAIINTVVVSHTGIV